MSDRPFRKFSLAFKYFRYLLFSSNGKGHGVHSPFVFDFIINVINDDSSKDIHVESIENLRGHLLNSKVILPDQDLGAGKFSYSRGRTVSYMAKRSLKSPKYAGLLFRLVSYYKPDSILEMGTSFGLTTQYLSLANPEAIIRTIEGSPAIAEIAQAGFLKNGFHKIQQTVGDFSDFLVDHLSRMEGKKLVFIDGNHRFHSTLNYFEEIMKTLSADDILVFDDIHWSKGMEDAWEHIKADSRVRCTIDLFFMGIVFFKSGFLEKQNFMIRF
jgi:predicted O-methyltransferase YrrM